MKKEIESTYKLPVSTCVLAVITLVIIFYNIFANI